jgi:hypothetical protein
MNKIRVIFNKTTVIGLKSCNQGLNCKYLKSGKRWIATVTQTNDNRTNDGAKFTNYPTLGFVIGGVLLGD